MRIEILKAGLAQQIGECISGHGGTSGLAQTL
jgi:hypothetical protein